MPESRTSPIIGIDGHAHVFSSDLSLTAGRRYTPDYDATLDAYLRQLRENGLSHGVLVQPSFLGSDNQYLLDALAKAPEQLRGVAVVDADISRDELRHMDEQGIVGIRLNLMGKPLPDFTEPGWKRLLDEVSALGWHVELHRGVEDIPTLIRGLMPFGCKIVVDHFGRPDAPLGVDHPAFQALLECGLSGRVWVKVSAIYRLGGSSAQNAEFARAALPLLLTCFGSNRLVWGSDWPHTQHEREVDFAHVIKQLQGLQCSDPVRHALLVDAPQVLFGFAVP
ncbi:amidohydrolase family protein [Pseudomonas viridiflava]|uniref:amidohydrolase family protein n=1 Tax=Pseudomonas viridiflava TaxID=33069 RepID=UPI000F05333C|nr:amidohydrolase family protein [Pseudomonas viridiflava]